MEKPTKEKSTNHPHNNFFEKSFKISSVMESFIEEVVSELQGKLELGSFRVVPDTWYDSLLKQHRADLLYAAKLKYMNVFIHLLLEHKIAGLNPRLQLLRYIALKTSEQQLIIEVENRTRKKENKKAKKKDKQPLLDKKLTLIVPIIIYHGKTKLDKRELADLFALPDSTWAAYIPKFKVIFIDLKLPV